TLAAQLEQTRILLEAVPGDPQPKTVLADLGYRGVDAELGAVKLIHRGKYKTLSEKQRKWLKRRQAVEPIIGHVKQDHGLRRCWLKGASGDALHAVLCATGFNLRWLLRAMARLGVGPVLLRWLRHVKRAAFAHDFLTIARQLRVGAPMCSPFRRAAALTRAIQLATSSR
ncbi:transposase, partial [Burkholderia ubonensis]|uniref:transposase n=1 Tax=Burkholderia ubonensis TaxID=101571 RepID=UPI000ACD2E74